MIKDAKNKTLAIGDTVLVAHRVTGTTEIEGQAPTIWVTPILPEGSSAIRPSAYPVDPASVTKEGK